MNRSTKVFFEPGDVVRILFDPTIYYKVLEVEGNGLKIQALNSEDSPPPTFWEPVLNIFVEFEDGA